MYFVIVDITTMVSESEKLVSTIILCTRGKDLQGEKSTCLPVYLSLCVLTYINRYQYPIPVSVLCNLKQSSVFCCTKTQKLICNSKKDDKKVFLLCSNVNIRWTGWSGHFKTIFISLKKKELCKKEKCNFLTLKNSVVFLPETRS